MITVYRYFPKFAHCNCFIIIRQRCSFSTGVTAIGIIDVEALTLLEMVVNLSFELLQLFLSQSAFFDQLNFALYWEKLFGST